MALFKSKVEKIKALMEGLSEEEKVELKKLIDGEDIEVEEDEVEETESVEETPAGNDEVETEEDAVEETPTEEGAPEKNADETPTEETPSEEAPVEEEAPTEEAPTEELPQPEAPVEPEVDEKDEKIKALEVQVVALQDSINNLLAKVEPILAQFEEVNNTDESAGLGQPNAVTNDEYEGMTAHELALKLAKY